MKTIVINLPHRTDRLRSFQKNWSFLDFEVVSGQISNVPHSGCGLAHINAIRRGLQDHEWCLILEDDAKLNCDENTFRRYVNSAVKNLEWDAVFLGAISHTRFPKPDTVIKMNDYYFSVSQTKSLRDCTAMLWSRNALPLINEFEKIIKDHIFPIDRMLTSFKYPWIVDAHGEGDDSAASYEINPRPKVWISKECLVFQDYYKSDNSGLFRAHNNDDYLAQLFNGAASHPGRLWD
jgi:hypothetical protein